MARRCPRPTRLRFSSRRRRGIAALVVFLMLAVTLSLSYAAIRSQSIAARLQNNASRHLDARQAARSGACVALRKMQQTNWGGTGSSFSAALNASQSFQVSYVAGDSRLSASDPEYADLPYRVTVAVTGYAVDPENPQCVATHKLRVIVRLVPRAVPAEPSDWSRMKGYTVYQTKKDPFELDIPSRLQGPIRVQGKLKIGPHYPNDSDARERYFKDLNRMTRFDGWPDYRPLNGPVTLPYSEQDGLYFWILTWCLDVSAPDASVSENASDWVMPSAPVTYQVYPGGPTYSVPSIGSTLEDTTLSADPDSNPLGIFYRAGNLELKSNVTVRGSLFCRDDLTVTGTNVVLQAIDLPALHGSSGVLQIPAVVCRDLRVKPTAGGSLKGLAAVFEEFDIEKSPASVSWNNTGQVIARKFFIKERQPWETLNWKDRYNAFMFQLGWPGAITRFPVWLSGQGYPPAPLITIVPSSTPVQYHWYKSGDSLYLANTSDPGLRWEIVAWLDNS